MYMANAAQNQEDVNNIYQTMKSAKGPGNFRNLFMYSPTAIKMEFRASRCQKPRQRMSFLISGILAGTT